jgi:hypothetical protein
MRFARFRPARVTVGSVRRTVLAATGLIGALALAGCAAHAGTVARPAPAVSGTAGGTVRTCAAYAYRAIERHQAVTGMPAACAGLSRAEVNQAASTAIRQASGGGPKSAWRKQAGLAAPWVSKLLTGQVPAPASGHPAGGQAGGGQAGGGQAGGGQAGGGGSLLGGVSELSVKVSALLAWLATAASGGYILARWLLAGGRPRRRNPTAAPAAVTVGHAGSGVFGLVLWITFMATGVTALAWISVAIMAPVAGLGMAVLMLGLPAPRSGPGPRSAVVTQAPALASGGAGAATATLTAPAAPAAAVKPRSQSRIPVLAIAAHGIFATTALLLVLLAAIGAG